MILLVDVLMLLSGEGRRFLFSEAVAQLGISLSQVVEAGALCSFTMGDWSHCNTAAGSESLLASCIGRGVLGCV